ADFSGSRSNLRLRLYSHITAYANLIDFADARIDRLAELPRAESAEDRDRFDPKLEHDLLVAAESERVVDVGDRGFEAVQVADDLDVATLESVQVAVVLHER